MVVRNEGIGGGEELEFGGVTAEKLTERTQLAGSETFGFKYFICGLDAVVVLIGREHMDPKFVDVIVGGECVTIGVNEWKGRFAGGRGCCFRRVSFGIATGARAGMRGVWRQRAVHRGRGMRCISRSLGTAGDGGPGGVEQLGAMGGG